MSHRYKIRAFESADQDGMVEAGAIVVPIDRSFTLYARSVDDAENKVRADVAAENLPKGRVYQVYPPFGNAEAVRAFSVSLDGKYERAYLDPASGIYSEFRRIRYNDLRKNLQREETTQLQQA